jgi:hypothetical protein
MKLFEVKGSYDYDKLHRLDPDNPNNPYKVWDTKEQKWVGLASLSKKNMQKRAARLDNEHSSPGRFVVKKVYSNNLHKAVKEGYTLLEKYGPEMLQFLAKAAIIYAEFTDIFGEDDGIKKTCDELSLKYSTDLEKHDLTADEAVELAQGMLRVNSEDDIRAYLKKGP